MEGLPLHALPRFRIPTNANMLAFSESLLAKDSISSQDIITQEITKPEESIRIKWSVCLLGIFCSCKFKEEVISFWPKCPALVLCLAKGAWVILIGMLYYEARTIPQHEVQTLPAPGSLWRASCSRIPAGSSGSSHCR